MVKYRHRKAERLEGTHGRKVRKSSPTNRQMESGRSPNGRKCKSKQYGTALKHDTTFNRRVESMAV
nr:MAG TPA: hypothetical protein [Caudoviricetes sp.]